VKFTTTCGVLDGGAIQKVFFFGAKQETPQLFGDENSSLSGIAIL
jgi:hypothetical protein